MTENEAVKIHHFHRTKAMEKRAVFICSEWFLPYRMYFCTCQYKSERYPGFYTFETDVPGTHNITGYASPSCIPYPLRQYTDLFFVPILRPYKHTGVCTVFDYCRTLQLEMHNTVCSSMAKTRKRRKQKPFLT